MFNSELLQRGYAYQRLIDGYHIYLKETRYAQNHGFLIVHGFKFGVAVAQKGEEYFVAIAGGGKGLQNGPFSLDELLLKLDEFDKRILA